MSTERSEGSSRTVPGPTGKIPRADLVGAVRQSLSAVAPDLPYLDVRPLAEVVAPQLGSWRLGATMFTAFGLLALAVAALGLYGVLAPTW